MSDLTPWILAGLTALFLYTRFAGKTSPTEARSLVAAGAVLLDVRSAAEFAAGHLDGAINVPVDQLPARISDVGPTGRSVVVYCRSGARSARAAGILRAHGFARVEDLGAMGRW